MSYGVVIPAHNAAGTIGETLRSVLAQSVAPAEILVVDDGSDDATAEIAADSSGIVRVFRQENTGPGLATSRGIAEARSPIIATVDADDIWLPEKMERQLAALSKAPPRSLVFARHRQFSHGSQDFTAGEERPGMTRSDLVFRKEVFGQIGDIIDPVGNRGDMVDWLARAREAGCPFIVLDEVLVLRRILPGSLSYGKDRERDRGYLAVAHRALERRRQRMKEERIE